MNREEGRRLESYLKSKERSVVQNIPAIDVLGLLFISEMTLHHRALRLTASLKTR